MGFQLPFKDLLQKIKQKIGLDVKVYLVGGAIRDTLLQQPVKDLDFLIVGDSQVAAKKVAKALSGVNFVIDDKRQTSRVLLTSGSRQGLILDFNKLLYRNILEDLRSRDFSINAVAIDLDQPEVLIDPLHGQTDLENKKLVLCSSNSLEHDPIRILRAVRFAILINTSLSKSLVNSIQKAIPNLKNTSAERQRDELFRILALPNSVFAVGLLDELGVIRELLPEITRLKDFPIEKCPGLTYWDKTLKILQNMEIEHSLFWESPLEIKEKSSAEIMTGFGEKIQKHMKTPIQAERERISLFRLGILLHAIGVPMTQFTEWDSTVCHFGSSKEGAQLIPSISERLTLSNSERDYLCKFTVHQDSVNYLSNFSGELLDRNIFRFFRDSGSIGIDISILHLLEVKALTTDREEIDRANILVKAVLSAYWERNISNQRPLLDGEAIMKLLHISPGAVVGRAIEILLEEQAVGKITSRTEGEKFLKAWYSKFVRMK